MGLDSVTTTTREPAAGGRVYMDFFGLKGVPFSITPDPDFLFLSDTHCSVIEKIQYGIESRMGFMLLTGEVGTGKSTLCRLLLDRQQALTKTVYLINPSLSGKELIASILDDLGLTWPPRATKKTLIDLLNRFLLSLDASHKVVVIIDDAQSMPVPAMEDLRLLTNLETDKRKLLQILLVGQPELLTHLDRPELRQLKQRIAVNCMLEYLSREEVRGYIEQRLFVAGNQGQVRFSPKAIRLMYKLSNGIPRIINKISDMSLTAAYTGGSSLVEVPHLRIAFSELIESRPPNGSLRKEKQGRLWWLLAAGLILAALLVMGWHHPFLAYAIKTVNPAKMSMTHEKNPFSDQFLDVGTLGERP